MKIEVETVADVVTGTLRNRLLTGHYSAGDQLRDTELATEFGVARPTVRAAVQSLVADGLLERGKGRSAVVPVFSAEDALDLYCLRRPIELEAVSIVIREKHSVEGVRQAARKFNELAETATWDQVSELDVAFHRSLFEAAASPRLLRTFEAVSVETRLLIAQLQPAYGTISELAQEHQLLFEELEKGNLKNAQTAWSGHFDNSEKFFLQLIKEQNAKTN